MFWAILALAIALSAVELRCEALQLPAAPGEPICTAEGAEKTAITVCTLNVQAGIPYSGKIAEYRACPGEKPQFSAFWETAGETSNL